MTGFWVGGWDGMEEGYGTAECIVDMCGALVGAESGVGGSWVRDDSNAGQPGGERDAVHECLQCDADVHSGAAGFDDGDDGADARRPGF